MSRQVYLTFGAEQDVNDIYEYISKHDSFGSAEYVIREIEKIVNSLKHTPERGTVVKELAEIGISDFRELYFKPYRIIYKATEVNVYVMLIVDGRRSLQTVLERRLISG